MIMIEQSLFKEIETYCGLNGIKDVKGFISKLLKDSFNIEKYGIQPFIDNKQPKETIIEKVVEKIVYINDDAECLKKIDELTNKYELEIDSLKKINEEKNNLKSKGDIYGE